ncbi:2-C-methyl-D-erythritol 4-phosphate cytidylyltransferase/2-C-methyl-D-erythritol 2,4-cyclodiphosphate synthase [Inquilinus ginsengisoli]|uniref:Bifunctional enzyme IspD/IspF n=1 Tax=Inquilinus ginsengisoli TaxID=363840 RepID=A0ABU1JXJ2_9PROT|nr:bifunctional 2-C-methyl-D-erythritol 4-phosphate cytidylyltransferase/2-C-methyl-D-erythritol 2,4-cyclodiphosphate synthase [Inquilinus ginsengisoli]MDR6293007.1 2-C-methyl-D-erythritol 4-phosphate cytidylyltransferase/2-C-methyl-D-erythritol 2,4-cyclodiphosphate synthase [Inquilinus ginsengisoli]
MPRHAAVIVAAGTGERFGGSLPKQYRPLAGSSVLRRSVEAFRASGRFGDIVVVIRDEHRALYDATASDLGLPDPVIGGATRQDSVRAALEWLASHAPDGVLVHDAARPLVDQDTIARVLDALETAEAAIAAVPVVDTIKRAEGGIASGTVDRSGLWQAQTPQGFRFATLLAAHRAAAGESLTDDAAVAERQGIAVRIVEGHVDNFKITTEADLTRAERLLGGADIRTGTGFDVHRLVPGDGVILCGVHIPHPFKLDGHSDADVGLHALTDALLGAIGAGDIGQHFPPSDERWRGADSAAFLAHAASLVRARGTILNVDVTLMCERPKIGPNRAAMVARVAEILQLDPERVSVKATTTERLGFTGREEGIAAQASASVRIER